jgi:hypothetical protein
MFKEAPGFYPRDEIEEDEERRKTGIFTASCTDETAMERLEAGVAG